MNHPIPELVLASHNPGKLQELREMLGKLGIRLRSQAEFGVGEVEETGNTFVENALLKARHAARISGLPALADDSGLCVAALDGAPGLRSARYAGPDGGAQANMAKLLGALLGIPDAQRGAHFHCSLALLRHADDPAPLICEGRWPGRILHEPRGSGGFGYDPLFLDTASGRSAAELSREEKAAVSHRGQALAALLAALARLPV